LLAGCAPKGKPFEDLRWSRFKDFDAGVMMEIVDEHEARRSR
jgi:type I restriction enzyme M protein